ncbi:MAG: hypothetical protein PHO93_00185 [Candidatus Saccharimonadaceae bacterium]|nr:hypothetical protein [Candidatus Saccharimonadaceae bacterium]
MVRINNKQSGAVSLFIVIFTTLLMTIATISFTRIMLQDQEEATTTDLSQSAFDSAQAGVEDGKRALLRYLSICNEKGYSSADCQAEKDNFKSDASCNQAVLKLSDVQLSATGDIPVKTGNNSSLEQAYTCVKIKLNTDDYLGIFTSQDQTKLIPLNGVAGFNTVQVEWFNVDDAGGNFLDLLSWANVNPGSALPLRRASSWPDNRPPVMRTQIIQFASTFDLGQLDTSNSVSSDNSTVFLYPFASPTASPTNITGYDMRSNGYQYIISTIGSSTIKSNQPVPIYCVSSYSGGENFACKAQIKLPDTVGGARQNLFLRLKPLYNGANYRVTLLNDTDSVQFSAVQPEIDSTGRANTLYRRVASRVELTDIDFPYPDAEIDINGSFCKDFSITDSEHDYNKIQAGYSADVSGVGSCTE